MITALYARVSTQEQAQNGHSIDEQVDRMRSYCSAMKWTVYDVYADKGFTGANTSRPALQRLLTDVRAGRIEKVLVYKLDRLSRSQKDTLDLIEDTFLANNTDFVSMSENFDTATPFGRAMIGILAVFAQLEREQIKERMLMGKEARAKQGKFNGSNHVPIGYDYDNGFLIPNAEAIQVQRAFELAAENKSPNAIAEALNASGFRNKWGSWTGRSVRRVLTNRTYLGFIRYGQKWYQATHDPLVTEEAFSAVQNAMEIRSQHHLQYNSRAGKATSYLGGLLFCGRCGAKYVKHTHKTPRSSGGFYVYENYYCNSRARKNRKYCCHDPECDNRSWKVADLTDIVFGEIRSLALEPAAILEPSMDSRIARIRSEISKIDGQLSRLIDLYSLGLPVDQLKRKASALSDQKTALQNECERLSAEQKKRLSKDESLRIVRSFDDVLDRGEFDEIRSVVETLIRKIVLDGDEVTIHWNFS